MVCVAWEEGSLRGGEGAFDLGDRAWSLEESGEEVSRTGNQVLNAQHPRTPWAPGKFSRQLLVPSLTNKPVYS